MKHLILCALVVCGLASHATAAEKPNVLFIAIDDLNHWVTHLGRNPQAKTPNIDRLAAMGLTFEQAYCPVPACEPSRCAIMGGRRPWTTGCYRNGDKWKNFQEPGEGLSAQFLKAGYHVAGAGKIYHSMAYHEGEWSEYMSKEGKSSNGPGVEKLDGFHIDKVHPDLKDEDLIDWHSTDYIIERLQEEHDRPFFLACGLYKPHLAFVAPRKYYEPFPLDSIELPPHIDNDLADIGPSGVRMAGPQGDHARFLKSGRWKAAIQSYLATCAYTDMNVGRLLDALEKSPNKDNTIVVLWTDHGWSFGEKEHWRKFALLGGAHAHPLHLVGPGHDDSRNSMPSHGGFNEHLPDALRTGRIASAGTRRGREHRPTAQESRCVMGSSSSHHHSRPRQSRGSHRVASIHPLRQWRGRTLRSSHRPVRVEESCVATRVQVDQIQAGEVASEKGGAGAKKEWQRVT